MSRTSDAALVAAWEHGIERHALDRALILLALCSPEVDPSALARVCLGEREDRLLGLRASLFGDRLEAYASCPACQTGVEVELSVRSLRERPQPVDASAVTLTAGNLRARARLPDSLDLAAVVRSGDAARARDVLLSRVVCDLQRDGLPATLDALDESDRAALSDALGEADPRAETLLGLACTDCGASWTAPLDVSAYLWRELEREVRRLLDEVAALARAYGWSEGDILAMGRRRRRAYLERAGA